MATELHVYAEPEGSRQICVHVYTVHVGANSEEYIFSHVYPCM